MMLKNFVKIKRYKVVDKLGYREYKEVIYFDFKYILNCLKRFLHIEHYKKGVKNREMGGK